MHKSDWRSLWSAAEQTQLSRWPPTVLGDTESFPLPTRKLRLLGSTPQA